MPRQKRVLQQYTNVPRDYILGLRQTAARCSAEASTAERERDQARAEAKKWRRTAFWLGLSSLLVCAGLTAWVVLK